MPNAVYTLIAQSLAEHLPKHSAAALLEEALRERGFSPEEVTATQMATVLSGPLALRLADLPQGRAALQHLRETSLSMASAPADAPPTGDTSAEGLPDADDFEFEDPEYAAAPTRRFYLLDTLAGQEELIRDLGRLAGVHGVLVTRESGEILQARALRDASQLGSVIAATATLFRRRGLRLLSADLGNQTVCMRPAHGYCVTVVAGPNVNTGRLLAELQQAELRLSPDGP